MHRRTFLGALGAGGVVGTVGFGLSQSRPALMDPSVHTDAPGRRALVFSKDGEEVASFGVDASDDDGVVHLDTELWHRKDTTVESIRLRVWLPDADSESGVEIGVVSPVEGDSSPPPELTLSTPERKYGEVIEITDLDDLADETISTLSLLVDSGPQTATTVGVDATIELASNDWLASGYTLDGTLELDVPADQ